MVTVNIALYGKATASTEATAYGDYYDHNANDGNTATRWAATTSNGWWKVDLGSNPRIDNLYIMTGTTAYSFTIGGSNNDSTYDTFITASYAVRNSLTLYDGFSVKYRYYKVTFTDGVDWSSINEIQLWTSVRENYLHGRRDRINMGLVSMQNKLA